MVLESSSCFLPFLSPLALAMWLTVTLLRFLLVPTRLPFSVLRFHKKRGGTKKKLLSVIKQACSMCETVIMQDSRFVGDRWRLASTPSRECISSNPEVLSPSASNIPVCVSVHTCTRPLCTCGCFKTRARKECRLLIGFERTGVELRFVWDVQGFHKVTQHPSPS